MTSTISITKPRTKRTAKTLILSGAKGRHARRQHHGAVARPSIWDGDPKPKPLPSPDDWNGVSAEDYRSIMPVQDQLIDDGSRLVYRIESRKFHRDLVALAANKQRSELPVTKYDEYGREIIKIEQCYDAMSLRGNGRRTR